MLLPLVDLLGVVVTWCLLEVRFWWLWSRFCWLVFVDNDVGAGHNCRRR